MPTSYIQSDHDITSPFNENYPHSKIQIPLNRYMKMYPTNQALEKAVKNEEEASKPKAHNLPQTTLSAVFREALPIKNLVADRKKNGISRQKNPFRCKIIIKSIL